MVVNLFAINSVIQTLFYLLILRISAPHWSFSFLKDDDLMDLFFPEGVPLNPDGKASPQSEISIGPGSPQKTGNPNVIGSASGFDGFDRLSGGASGALGSSGGLGSGPNSRDMSPISGPASSGGEGHTHVYVGGAARDG